ncbi:FkbM family methyltransferase [Priestia megaterium]|uniref:FkbM family methyltransferase n=1 Tax=Priestia megaterium TaxID=1404 RepID=UPI002E20B7D1|nr:FkbM family methyltransferase [Priestia megaterium]MED3831563.1 FkbM family methyltransferase [Priestia megaterium]
MHGIYVGNNKMLIHTIAGYRLYSYADDKSLTPDLIFKGVFELPLTNYMIRNLRLGDTVIDAGANIGYFTALAALKVGTEGKVISYEASKRNFDLLKENVAFLCLGNTVDLRNKAVYKEEKELTFFASHQWNGNGSLLKHDEAYFNHFKTDVILEEKIQGEPLNVHIDKDFIHLIKMDIEGGEFDALVGLENLLKAKKVGKVIFELNKLRAGSPEAFFELLNSYQNNYGLTFGELNTSGDVIPTTLEALFERDFVESVVMDCTGPTNNHL